MEWVESERRPGQVWSHRRERYRTYLLLELLPDGGSFRAVRLSDGTMKWFGRAVGEADHLTWELL